MTKPIEEKLATAHYEELPMKIFKYDHEIQRDVNHKRVKEMNDKGFSYAAIQTIAVNVRDNGDVYVIDGHHRIELLKLNGYTKAPCMVSYGKTRKEEAQEFIRLNQNNKKMTATLLFHRKIIAEDVDAIQVNDALSKLGLQVTRSEKGGKQKNTISAIASCEWIYKDGGANALLDTLLIIVNTWGRDNNYSFDSMVLRGTYVFFKKYSGQINVDNFMTKLRTSALESIIAKARYLITLKISAPNAFAKSLLDYYNSGKRTKKLADLFNGVERQE